ncbi:MAG: hypothetical protein ACK6DC_10255 [Planctomycetota bacterium]|jgi:hypothetical protein
MYRRLRIARPVERGVVALIFLAFASAVSWGQPSVQTPDGLKLVFEDRFDQGLDRWETTDDASWGIVSVGKNPSLELSKSISAYAPKVRSPHNIALIRNLQASDFVMTFRVRSLEDRGNHRDCCVFFGHQDPEHFYYVHLGAKPDPASGQIMIVDGAPRRPLTKNERPVPWDDDWHQVKLVRDTRSGRIEIFFDDMSAPLMTIEDRTFQTGRLGIGSFDDRNAYDDVRVYLPVESTR